MNFGPEIRRSLETCIYATRDGTVWISGDIQDCNTLHIQRRAPRGLIPCERLPWGTKDLMGGYPLGNAGIHGTHRTILGKGPDQFKDFFRRDPAHPVKLIDPRQVSRAPLTKRSALGLVAIYNMLPHNVVGIQTVPAFQKGLQGILSKYATSGYP